MKHLIDFPAVPLAQLPTPLHRLDNLSRELGKNLYIKRPTYYLSICLSVCLSV